MQIPILQDVLGLSPVSLTEWGILLAATCIIILAMELFKLVYRFVYNADEPRNAKQSSDAV